MKLHTTVGLNMRGEVPSFAPVRHDGTPECPCGCVALASLDGVSESLYNTRERLYDAASRFTADPAWDQYDNQPEYDDE